MCKSFMTKIYPTCRDAKFRNLDAKERRDTPYFMQQFITVLYDVNKLAFCVIGASITIKLTIADTIFIKFSSSRKSLMLLFDFSDI